MRLVHYSPTPIAELNPIDAALMSGPKPRGFWVSDDDDEINWRSWCEGENFRLDCLAHAHEVTPSPGANILILDSTDAIDEFTRGWQTPIKAGGWRDGWSIEWWKVSQQYQGIIITPYQWERRLSDHTMWYYGWDCASGCIFDLAVIASITLRSASLPTRRAA